MPFITPAVLRHVPDRNLWKLAEELVWVSSPPNDVLVIHVPVGTETDLASTPRLAWFLVPPMDRHIVEPAILHDYLYQQHGKLPGLTLSRAQCDALLAQAITQEGGKPWYRWLVHTSVRAFGGHAWASEPTR
jgi:hypothetical protein